MRSEHLHTKHFETNNISFYTKQLTGLAVMSILCTFFRPHTFQFTFEPKINRRNYLTENKDRALLLQLYKDIRLQG